MVMLHMGMVLNPMGRLGNMVRLVIMVKLDMNE